MEDRQASDKSKEGSPVSRNHSFSSCAPSSKVVARSRGERLHAFKTVHVFIRFAVGTDHRIAGHANPRGHEVRVRGCEIPHAEARAQATLVDGSLHP